MRKNIKVTHQSNKIVQAGCEENIVDIELAKGKNAVRNAMLNLYMRNYDLLKGASEVSVSFKTHSNFLLVDIENAMSMLEQSLEDDIDVAFTTTYDDTVTKDFAKVIMTLSGIKDSNNELHESSVLSFKTTRALKDKFSDFAKMNKKTNAQFLEDLLNEYSIAKPVDIMDIYGK